MGRLFIVGTGPGTLDQLSPRAKTAILTAETIIGNDTYLDAITPLLAGKNVIRSSMGKEVDRAKQAIELARTGSVAMVSGGDPGVYGMASIVLEVLDSSGADIPVEIVPGITAATAAASRVGSPLSSDFAVISLSDLLTPLEVIETRLHAVFPLGIPVVLYNPRSKGRPGNFALAMEIAGSYLPASTPIAIVKNAFRDGEETIFSTLGEIASVIDRVDMHSTVIVGGKETRFWKTGETLRGIITPRGYDRKYVY
ncbi:MAG: precorrin-3B C(17)-methyltransferase [Methanoregulaceae archaeon]